MDRHLGIHYSTTDNLVRERPDVKAKDLPFSSTLAQEVRVTH